MMMEPSLFICSKYTFRIPNMYLALLWTPCITVVNDSLCLQENCILIGEIGYE